MDKVIIRPLQIEDANISWKWRNDSEIWELTGRKWNNHVSYEIEKHWIQEILTQKDSLRFAICVGDSEEYVGNVQLTNINDSSAVFHIFIGNKKYWGRGIGEQATKLIIEYAKLNLQLNEIFLTVKIQNKVAIRLYEKVGFYAKDIENEFVLMRFVM